MEAYSPRRRAAAPFEPVGEALEVRARAALAGCARSAEAARLHVALHRSASLQAKAPTRARLRCAARVAAVASSAGRADACASRVTPLQAASRRAAAQPATPPRAPSAAFAQPCSTRHALTGDAARILGDCAPFVATLRGPSPPKQVSRVSSRQFQPAIAARAVHLTHLVPSGLAARLADGRAGGGFGRCCGAYHPPGAPCCAAAPRAVRRAARLERLRGRHGAQDAL